MFRTRQEEAYHRLRGDILAGRLRPGDKLPSKELCVRYDVSVGVIREALTRLLEQGLVQNTPQLGFNVTPISRSGLAQLTDARVEIETLTLRRAILDGDVVWESELVAAHHLLAATPLTEDDDPSRLSERWAELHTAFHATLLAGCPNLVLRDVARELRDSAELYRRWSVPLGGAPRDVGAEHLALVDATLRRDADEATAILAGHIRRTADVLLNSGVMAD